MNFVINFDDKIDEAFLDYTLVPLGLLVLVIYNVWLLFTIQRYPTRTVIGLNRVSRHQWVFHMMSDPQKNGILAIQTIRNNMMASTLLATISITLSSLISAVVSGASESLALTYTIHTVKYFSILICFLSAFFCSMQCIRYYAHVSFLINVPSPEGKDEFAEFVAEKLNRGCLFWSLALRAFYFSFPLLIWIFGPVAMFTCSCLMVVLLYFLDTVSPGSNSSNGRVDKFGEVLDEEAKGSLREADALGDSNIYFMLLENSKLGSSN